MPQVKSIKFGHFRFDLQDQRLSGPLGEIPLAVKSAEVFAFLVQRPGQIVTKDELLNAVWTDTAVTDDALVQRILDIRKALGDNSKNPQYIRTHPKRGYEFVGFETPDESKITIPPLRSEASAPSTFRTYLVAAALTGIAALAVALVFHFRRTPPNSPMPDLRMTQLTFRAGMDDYPSLDATGQNILYASDESGASNLWILDIATGEHRQITHSSAALSEPDWSPDGNWIAYRSEEGSGGLYAKSLVTGETLPVAVFGHHPRWSPDGQQVAFHSTGPQGSIYIWDRRNGSVKKVDVSGPQLNRMSWPAWGRDGHSLFFIAAVQFRTEKGSPESQGWVQLGHQIWFVSAAGGNATVATPGTGVVADGGFDYDREQSKLIFVGLDRGLWRSEVDPETGVETGKPVRLTLTTQGHQHPRTSLGGGIVFSAITGDEALWLVPFRSDGHLNDGAMVRLTAPAASVRDPVLSPDGRRIAYFIWQGERFELWLLDLATRKDRPIGPNDRLSRTGPVWSPDGHELTYTVLDGRDRELRRARFTPTFSQLIDEQKFPGNPPVPGDRGLSPNGRFSLILQQQDSQQAIWLERRGASPQQLTPLGHYLLPSWSSDGRHIFFQSDRDGWFNIWSLDFDPAKGVPVGEPQQISTFRGTPFLLSDNNLGFVVQSSGLVVPLHQNRSDLWMIQAR